MPKKAISMLLYFDRVYTAVARLIGYDGTTPFAFWDAAKLLPFYNQAKFQTAVFDLTRYDRREASPPTYELNAEARKWCWQLLGPAPERKAEYDLPPLRLDEPPAEKPEEPLPRPKKRKKRN